jgi:Tol biopolymer transport system component/DNA-binding winged helix-turn-helix (wHTH) protein
MQNSSGGTGRVIRFDVFEVDIAARQLRKRKRRVKMQDLPFRLLVALLEQPGEVVAREELRTRLWGGTAVEVDDGLHTAVRKLREVLGDSATRPRFIGTVPRQGYCFLAPVSVGETEHEEVPDRSEVPPSETVLAAAPEEIPVKPIERHPAARTVWMVCLGLLVLACIGVVFTRSHHASSPPSDVVPITSYRGVQRSPALSPDGSRVAFIWAGESGNNLDLYVQRIDGTGRVRLTTDPAPEESPAWSPAGGTIAFIRNGEIFTIPSTGGHESKMTTAAGSGLSWSPDARRIAFSDRISADGPLGIFLVSVDSGERRRLTSPAKAAEDDFSPAFSPDGQAVAFVRRATTATSVYRVPVSGGNPTRVAISGQPANGLVWSPDGQYLLLATGRHAPGLLAVPANARDATQLERVDIAGFNVSEPSIISRNNGREVDLAYAHEGTNWDIWGMAIGDHAASPVSLATSTRANQAPSFSPDGKQLAFSSARSGYEEIWVSMGDGSQPRQLTNFRSAVASSPRWSPDGRWIAFDAIIGNNPDIYLVRPEGGPPVRMTSEPSTEAQPNWSHDGRWLYFMSDRSGSKQVWKLPAGGGQSTQVTRHGGFQAFESGDGRYVYYAKQWHGRGVWRVPVNGGPETLVSDMAWHNLWTLAGDGLYYFDVEGQMPQVLSITCSIPVRRMDLATNKITTVATVEVSFPVGVPALDVTRNGKYLAWVNWREHDAELMLIRNLHLGSR